MLENNTFLKYYIKTSPGQQLSSIHWAMCRNEYMHQKTEGSQEASEQVSSVIFRVGPSTPGGLCAHRDKYKSKNLGATFWSDKLTSLTSATIVTLALVTSPASVHRTNSIFLLTLSVANTYASASKAKKTQFPREALVWFLILKTERHQVFKCLFFPFTTCRRLQQSSTWWTSDHFQTPCKGRVSLYVCSGLDSGQLLYSKIQGPGPRKKRTLFNSVWIPLSDLSIEEEWGPL